jgi:hypothetical protein
MFFGLLKIGATKRVGEPLTRKEEEDGKRRKGGGPHQERDELKNQTFL